MLVLKNKNYCNYISHGIIPVDISCFIFSYGNAAVLQSECENAEW